MFTFWRKKMKPDILVSACLLGQPVRYDGKSNDQKVAAYQAQMHQWQQQGRIIPICPEMLGGLPTPRPAAEIVQGQVITHDGQNVTDEFQSGAQKTLQLAQQHNAIAALLAARSPSCGSDGIYNGEFNGTLIDGLGVTAQLLEDHNIRCFSPDNFQALLDYLANA